jgi:hypothetical protein
MTSKPGDEESSDDLMVPGVPAVNGAMSLAPAQALGLVRHTSRPLSALPPGRDARRVLLSGRHVFPRAGL